MLFFVRSYACKKRVVPDARDALLWNRSPEFVEETPPSTHAMPEVVCKITYDKDNTYFEFIFPTEKTKITVPGNLNEEQCNTVIRMFKDQIENP